METLRVSLFGQFQVQRGTDDLSHLYPHKLQEVLSYLIFYRDRCHPRETLAGLFWGGSSTAQSKRYLRQALWQLQSIGDGDGAAYGEKLLLADADQVHVNPAAGLWLDVTVLEQASERAHGIAGHALDATRAEVLADAATLYRGDLLQGWFQDWCLYERERLQNLYLTMLDKLMDYCEAIGDCDAGLAYGACSLRYDEARERTHRRLMRLYALAGDRTAALRQYDRCCQALLRELAVKPAASTVALYQQIRGDDRGGGTTPAGPTAQDGQPSTAAAGDILERLRTVQQALASIQADLQSLLGGGQATLASGSSTARPVRRPASGRLAADSRPNRR